MTFTVSYAIVTSIMHVYIGGEVFVTRAVLLFKSIWSNFGPHSPQCHIFLNSCQGGQLPCLLSSWKHLNNAVGHSVSFLDVIINRDSVTQMEAPLNPRPSPHVIATIPFLHLILCLPAVIDFCPKEHYCQGRERSSDARWLFCVQEEDRQHSDTLLCLPLREKVTLFHTRIQSIMCLAACGWANTGPFLHTAGLRLQKQTLWISFNISIWDSGTIFSRSVAWQRHLISLCKCCGKFSKACEL